MASRFHEILRKDVFSDIETGPCWRRVCGCITYRPVLNDKNESNVPDWKWNGWLWRAFIWLLVFIFEAFVSDTQMLFNWDKYSVLWNYCRHFNNLDKMWDIPIAQLPWPTKPTCLTDSHTIYRQISNTRRTKFHNFYASHLVLQLSMSNLLKPGIKSRMKM